MMFQRRKRNVPGLNTTATADISFMLLVFFLVASSMDTDWGLPRQLPPPTDELTEQELPVKERNVLPIEIDASDALYVAGQAATPAELTDRVAEFVVNAADNPSLPEKSRREVHLLGLVDVSDRHVLALHVSRHASYDAYFTVQNAVVAAYDRVRGELARSRFGHGLEQCSAEERAALALALPQRISESVDDEEEGGGQ